MGHDETMEMFAALAARDAEIAALKKEVVRLKLQSEHADCWWDDDNDFESPEEYADESDLKVGDEFELQAAAYWKERFRVKTVRDQETDEGDYDCEQLSRRREEFPNWFDLKAENAALKEKVAALEKRLEKALAPLDEEERKEYWRRAAGNLRPDEHTEWLLRKRRKELQP